MNQKRRKILDTNERNIPLEVIITINIYALNCGAPNFIKQTLLNTKGEIGLDTITVDDFNVLLLSKDSNSGKKLTNKSQS
jgi:hypothetical protein